MPYLLLSSSAMSFIKRTLMHIKEPTKAQALRFDGSYSVAVAMRFGQFLFFSRGEFKSNFN